MPGAGGAAVLATCATCTEATRPLEAWVLTGSGSGAGVCASARTATALRRPHAERRWSGTATAAPLKAELCMLADDERGARPSAPFADGGRGGAGGGTA